MESSVPLLASRYLRLRTNIYVAISQCYYLMKQPNEAEMFARRGLDKVNELAQLERQSSSSVAPESVPVYAESTVKLGVLIFKKALFESHKKMKLPFKFKSHPGVRDLLQLPSPRSSTEKLLGEMFASSSAQFLAVLETLTEPSRRALHRGPPHPLLDMESDAMADIYIVSHHQEPLIKDTPRKGQPPNKGGHSGPLSHCSSSFLTSEKRTTSQQRTPFWTPFP